MITAKFFLLVLLLARVLGAQTISKSDCVTPECFLEKISLAPTDFNEEQVRSYTKTMFSLIAEIEDRTKELKIIQQQDFEKYKTEPKNDISYQQMPAVKFLKSLTSDPILEKQEAEFAKVMVNLFEKYHIEAQDTRSADIAFAYRAAGSLARNGIEDTPGSRVATVKIPRRRILKLSKFNNDLTPDFKKFCAAVNFHLANLRSAEEASKRITNSIAIPILVRAVEIRNLSRLKLLIESTIKAYSKILYA